MIINKKILSVALFILLNGCTPNKQSDTPSPFPSSAPDEVSAKNFMSNEFLNTSLGKEFTSDLNSLEIQKYSIQINFVSDSEIRALNGHGGGGYSIENNLINIYVLEEMSDDDNAHVLVHELVHIQDDLEIQKFLVAHPVVNLAAENFVENYKTQSFSSFEKKTTSYVLSTLFCSEARAYTKNKVLANEGVLTNKFTPSDLPTFIDENYIKPFGTRYGSKANAMFAWCLSKPSMKDIQDSLIF